MGSAQNPANILQVRGRKVCYSIDRFDKKPPVGLVRGEIQLRHLLRLETTAEKAKFDALAEAAVDTFLRAFAPRQGQVEAGFRGSLQA